MEAGNSESNDINERTPLLLPTPPAAAAVAQQISNNDNAPRHICCYPGMWIMSVIFILGTSVGLYLLFNEARDYPISRPFFLVHRTVWGSNTTVPQGPAYTNTTLRQFVFIMQTGTKACTYFTACSEILKSIQKMDPSGDIPVNFLAAGDGKTYEGQGWRFHSKFNFSRYDATPFMDQVFFLSFIGNFTRFTPPKKQLEEAEAWLQESVRRRYLNPNYELFGLQTSPFDGQRLFMLISSWANYNATLLVPL